MLHFISMCWACIPDFHERHIAASSIQRICPRKVISAHSMQAENIKMGVRWNVCRWYPVYLWH